MIAALLLDLDGTLVDSEPLHREAYDVVVRRRGWADVDLSLFTGRRAADVFATEPGPWADLDPGELASEVMAVKPAGVPAPLPGAVELLRAAADVPVAVVTSARRPWVERALGPLGVLHLVDVVVTGADVAAGKPDPAGFALALHRLGVEAADAVAVEDSPAGVAAARAAGVGTVVGVTTSAPAPVLRAAGATTTYDDLWPLVRTVGGGA